MAANSTGNTAKARSSSSCFRAAGSGAPLITSLSPSRTTAVPRARERAQTSTRDCSVCGAEEAWRSRNACEVIPAIGISTPKKTTSPPGSPCSRKRLKNTAAATRYRASSGQVSHGRLDQDAGSLPSGNTSRAKT
jgi:hypothetical protein